MTAPLYAKDLTVLYGGRKALDAVDLSVPKGTVYGFLGPNGAGKSTLIKSLLGLVRPTSGTVLLNGLPPSNPAARRTIGYLPEETAYPKYLTPRELLQFYGRLSGLGRRDLDARIPALLSLVQMEGEADRRLGTFSKGMVQKIGLAQALVHDPDVLILDEPTSGLDPVAKLHLREILLSLKNRGKTLFFSSHELSEVELVCDFAAILVRGKIVRSGPRSQLVENGERNLERLFVSLVEGHAA